MVNRALSQIDLIVIHCAASADGSSKYDIKAIDIDHGKRKPPFNRSETALVKWRPWLKHVGYHAVVNPSGTIDLGRDVSEIGAHAAPFNKKSLGVCLIGTRKFTRNQWHSLRQIVSQWAETYRVEKIVGHRDTGAKKECPGFDVKTWLDGGMVPLQEHTL